MIISFLSVTQYLSNKSLTFCSSNLEKKCVLKILNFVSILQSGFCSTVFLYLSSIYLSDLLPHIDVYTGYAKSSVSEKFISQFSHNFHNKLFSSGLNEYITRSLVLIFFIIMSK
ncbi:hypothetical protein HOF65_05560 [bacterium]|nr:hypothetical protein [bacterium]MBT3853411.1 hypothetical protein [bacterium]MBT4633154.1 hypothetical protein [bacterium]MBT6778905.1 hypothetical protein [bacterium]